MSLIDTNVHLGPWPFSFLPEFNAPQLAAHLAAEGIDRALVSPLPAALAPDPLPANRTLFAAVRRTPTLLPLPVVNPALAHWREQLDATATGPLRAIKLLPPYHNYRPEAPRFAAFFAEVAARHLKVVVETRLEDDRHRYHGLSVKALTAKQLAPFLQRYPDLRPLVLGLGLPELRELAQQKLTAFSFDTAFVEWTDSIATLAKEFSTDRVMFGSHAPFLVARASLAKLTTAQLPAAVRRAFSSRNAEKFFGL
ncbi:amidohydrolase family protein [Horticoccus luteus]|uniref:Amidohydrolase family protein n=1 Tax=Horticoccus luteus TaxID=2862869 RepID=A0A8F9TS43_9BACT|nr:amidohydrolase family protein [Horticoccus luteus]QYM78001.1 amidohydrolase family protein [Horticoccus luteus]